MLNRLFIGTFFCDVIYCNNIHFDKFVVLFYNGIIVS